MLAHLDEVAEQQGAAAVAAEVTRDISDGAIKLWTTAQVLRLRRAEHALFRHGSYLPLLRAGAAEQHVIAHARQYRNGEDKETVIVAVPRFACSLMRGEVALPLGKAWKDWSLSLPSELQGAYRNIFTGETMTAEGALPLAQVFAQLSGRCLRYDLISQSRTIDTALRPFVTSGVLDSVSFATLAQKHASHRCALFHKEIHALLATRVLSAAAVLSLPLSACCSAARPQPKTAAAVIAADNGWDKAEKSGDVAYVDNLLLPDYRSVSADGSVHDKAAILANAKSNVGSPEHAAKVAKWRGGPSDGHGRRDPGRHGDRDLLSQAARAGERNHVERYLRLPRWRVARDLLAAHERG